MATSKKHSIILGDVVCNTKTGRFYTVAGYTLSHGGRRRVFLVCLETSTNKEILQEHPISFDKDTMADMVYVDNIATPLRQHIDTKGYKFDIYNVGFAGFRCHSK